MENSTFRLLVTAIVAIIIISIIIYFFPFWQPDIGDEINKGLDYAQSRTGKMDSKELFFEEGIGMQASSSFDTPERTVALKCNNPALCGEFIVVENRRLQVLKSFSAAVSTRCDYTEGLYPCIVYIGEEPAQLELMETSYKEKYDAGKETINIGVEVKNTGKLAAYDVETTAKVYMLLMRDNERVKELYTEPIVNETAAIAPGESKQVNFELPIIRNSSYEVQLRTWAMDAGFWQTQFEIEVTGGGIVETCKATIEGETSITAGECREKYLCEGCEFGFECRAKWSESDSSKEFEIADPEFAVIEYLAVNGNCGNEENGGNGENGKEGELIIDGKKLSDLVEARYAEYTGSGAASDMIEKSIDYGATIQNIANAKGIEANLIKAIIAAESSFRESAVSGAGAIGLMQVMPNQFCHDGYATVVANAIGNCIPESKRTDKLVNISIGADIFLFFYNYSAIRDCEHRTALALAAYNGGQTKIENCTIKASAPTETKEYPAKVLAYKRIFDEA